MSYCPGIISPHKALDTVDYSTWRCNGYGNYAPDSRRSRQLHHLFNLSASERGVSLAKKH